MQMKEQPIYAFRQPFRLHTFGKQATKQRLPMQRILWMLGTQDGEDELERTVLRTRMHGAKWGYRKPGQAPKEFSAIGVLSPR